MTVTMRFTDAEAEVLRRQAALQHSTVEDVVRQAISEHVARRRPRADRRVEGDVIADIEVARQDDRFVQVVEGIVERDQEILDRLAE